MTAAPLHLFLIAGEPSGDVLGGRLMAALKRLAVGEVRFSGIGGEHMMAEGLVPLFPMSELSVMGLAEVLPRLPRLIKRIGQTVRAVTTARPAALITIDAPDFSFRVARRVRAASPDIPLIHYVAPTVWAWRPGRARKIAKFLDHVLTLLPFEPPYFEREGLASTFVGHSVIEGGAGMGNAARFRAKHGIGPEERVVVVLPGSRTGEVTRLLPDFRTALELIAASHENLVTVVPTVPPMRGLIAEGLRDWPLRSILVTGEDEKFDAFKAAAVALAASGTVSLELALAGVPTVIAYRLNPLTWALARPLMRVRFASLANIIADRAIVPEHLMGECRPEIIAATLARLLDDPAARAAQLADLAKVPEWLGAGTVLPSERAARVVLDIALGRAS